MKIGIDIRTLMDDKYSGVPEYTYNLLKEILKLDYDNQYKFFYNSFSDVKLPKFENQNIKIIRKKYPNKIFNYGMQKALNYPKIDQLIDIDLFFMPHINFISLSRKCKSVLTVHDLSFLRYPEFFSVRKNIWHKMINVKKLIKKFNKIVAVSESTKNDVIQLCDVDKNKVKVIYSGIGEQYKKLDVETQNFAFIKNKYNLPNRFIFYLGNLEPRKNICGIIKAYNELRNRNINLENIKLIIAGGNGWKSKDIFKTFEKSKYKDDIKFLGYADASDKVYLYNLASLFVYPSFYEGFGFPPLEAMACGTPVVSSFSSSLPEVVGNAGLMVDPYNISDIARAMEQILIKKDLRYNLINKGFNQACKFKWENTAKQYLEYFCG
ncbi:MAG: glycosyltransferase family 1 protein [Candidatus Falkowbacteria bacterium]